MRQPFTLATGMQCTHLETGNMITEEDYNLYVKHFNAACATQEFARTRHGCQATGGHNRVVGSLHGTLIICNIVPYD